MDLCPYIQGIPMTGLRLETGSKNQLPLDRGGEMRMLCAPKIAATLLNKLGGSSVGRERKTPSLATKGRIEQKRDLGEEPTATQKTPRKTQQLHKRSAPCPPRGNEKK